MLVDVSVISSLCKTHIKASAEGPVGALLRKETQKCKHHEATAQRYEMEFVPFIVDMHGAHGPDAIHLLKRLAAQCPRPRLAGQHPKAQIYEEMAASAISILRSVTRVLRLGYADAFAARGVA